MRAEDGSPVPGTDREPGTGVAARAVPGSRHTGGEPGTGPADFYADIAGLLDGTLPDPPEPEVLRRSDGRALFYRDQVNLVFGDPETGKTMVAAAAVAEVLSDGGRVLVLDLDHNGPAATVSRLVMLGAPVAALRDLARFRYLEPEDAGELRAAVQDARTWRPDLVTLDSIGELLPLFRASSNSPDDFTLIHSLVMKPLAMTGAAVVCIDHLAKNTESRAHGATGTAAKRRAIGGVSLRVKLLDPFVPGKGGSAVLLIHKDRHGGLRQHSPTDDREPIAGTFVLGVEHGRTTWKVTAPAMGDRNPEEAAPPADLAAVAALDPPARSGQDVAERLHWRKARALTALREHRRTAVPGSPPVCREPGTARRARTTCTVCSFPMTVVEANQTTHPTCREDTP